MTHECNTRAVDAAQTEPEDHPAGDHLLFTANLDKSNISIAALDMNADLGMTATMYGLGVSVFYITYMIFEVPSNLLMTKVGPESGSPGS